VGEALVDAEGGDAAEFGPDFRNEVTIGGKIGSADRNLHRRGRPEIHDLADDVSRFERKLRVGEHGLQVFSELGLQIIEAYGGVRLQGYAEDAVLGPAHPERNCVHRVGGGNRSHIAERDLDVVSSGKPPNLLLDRQCRLLGDGHAAARRRAEAKLHLACRGAGKNLAPQARCDQKNDSQRHNQISGDDNSPVSPEPHKKLAMSVAQPG